MHISLFTLIVFVGSLLAGFLGALTGLGGGVVVVPLLTLLLGVDIRYAIGASLVSVIATSSGAAAAYVREGYSNIRIGMFLEVATTLGALLGAYLATRVHTSTIGIVFGLVLLFSAYFSAREPKGQTAGDKPDARVSDGSAERRASELSYRLDETEISAGGAGLPDRELASRGVVRKAAVRREAVGTDKFRAFAFAAEAEILHLHHADHRIIVVGL